MIVIWEMIRSNIKSRAAEEELEEEEAEEGKQVEAAAEQAEAPEEEDRVHEQRDDAGEITAFSIAARGILITVTSLVAFIGSGYLLLYTNVGKRLAFLITGAATFGWMVIGSVLFIVYAPRGIRPSSIEGLNAFQIRIPAIALTLASLILFLMFVAALDRYEKEQPDV